MTTKNDAKKTTEILLHHIEYSYRDGFAGEVDESDIEHIEQSIREGCNQGELCTSDPKNPNETHYGWWAINN